MLTDQLSRSATAGVGRLPLHSLPLIDQISRSATAKTVSQDRSIMAALEAGRASTAPIAARQRVPAARSHPPAHQRMTWSQG